nr:energy transducer TonB [Planctomycetota bacterium]
GDATPIGAAADPGVLRRIAPAYPARSRRHGDQGRVDLQVTLDPLGHPLVVDIARSSGFARLDEAARAAVRQWLFTPPQRWRSPIRLVSVEFRLR